MSQMYCQECESPDNKVTQVREHQRFNWIYRRRVCNECGHRWNTYELPADDIAGFEESE